MSAELVTEARGLERGSTDWLAVAHGRATGDNAMGLAAAGARARKLLVMLVGSGAAVAALGGDEGVDAANSGDPSACAAITVLSRGSGAPAAIASL